MKISHCLALALLLFSTQLHAAELTTLAGNNLAWQVPEGWQQISEPPQELLKELTEQIQQEAKAKGKTPTPDQLDRVARNRLAANEILIYHPESHALITIDISPLRQAEDPPSTESLKLSATYALQSLKSEEGVSRLQSSQHAQGHNAPHGTQHIEATYLRNGIETEFIGLIGYMKGEWVFIYTTSYPQKSGQHHQIMTFLNGLEFSP